MAVGLQHLCGDSEDCSTGVEMRLTADKNVMIVDLHSGLCSAGNNGGHVNRFHGPNAQNAQFENLGYLYRQIGRDGRLPFSNRVSPGSP